MFNIVGKQKEEFFELYEAHRMNISATNVYFQNIRLLNTTKFKYMSRDDYKEYYKNILDDIENTSPPTDSIIPNQQEFEEDENGEYIVPEDYEMFIVNRDIVEYQTILKRVKDDNMSEVLPDTHPAKIAIIDNPDKFDDVVDEIFIQWLIFDYLKTIEKLHLHTLSNFTPVIEYVVNNITEKELKNFLTRRKIDEEKFDKLSHEFVFKPDLNRMQKFYEEKHESCEAFDVTDLIKRLVTNEVVRSDVYIITAIFLTLSFAMSDIYINNITDSPCAKYAVEVLSKI